MPGIPHHGGNRLRHRVVAITQAAGVSRILEANPARLRVQMFNAGVGGSIVYVGDRVDVANAALAAANGWPLTEESINDVEDKYWKHLANVLELFTKDDVFGLAIGADSTVKMIEEYLA